MLVNKYKILVSDTEKNLTIPFSMNLDLLGRGDTIDEYQEKVIDDVAAKPIDYETTRFSCKPNTNGNTSITYTFNFSGTNEYENSYVVDGKFNAYQIFYNTAPIRKSFFKLDFYDSADPTKQRIYFSLILAPRQTVQTENKTYNNVNYNIKIPKFILDHVGEKEGYYIYFFENVLVTELRTFYMKVKFFSGLDGQYTIFSSSPQSNYTNPFNVPNSVFYYELNLDYSDRTYYFKNLAGQVIQELTWYEYKNKV
jgi:hypothetical protein